jgi:hypothetical protein
MSGPLPKEVTQSDVVGRRSQGSSGRLHRKLPFPRMDSRISGSRPMGIRKCTGMSRRAGFSDDDGIISFPDLKCNKQLD